MHESTKDALKSSAILTAGLVVVVEVLSLVMLGSLLPVALTVALVGIAAPIFFTIAL